MARDSPSARVETTMEDADGAENIIRTFMVEQERRRPHRDRRNSVVDQIFRGDGQVVSQDNSPVSGVGIQLAVIVVEQLDNDFYSTETDSYIATLEDHPENRMSNLHRIIHAVFQHGITAGHVMSLLLFGYRYIHRIVNMGIDNAEQIGRDILRAIIDYVKDYVTKWIQIIGGWNGFLEEVKMFVRHQVAFWRRHQLELGLGVFAVLTAVNIGAIAYYMRN